ncbi:hypothetical protein CDD81_1352 [Ophiocordyceps australis]|uniref:MOZ protein represents a chromatin-associated acetyltransferase n=1 Tax=Ophiocordyceps australis TaxID=1399860 RepID=A0A2C5XZ15_9HYPO|nr:hypothetical protein CDD81_1352 [Ophiocordyceps australis]
MRAPTLAALQLGRRRLGGVATRAKGSFAPRHGKAIEPVAWRRAGEGSSKTEAKTNQTQGDEEKQGSGATDLSDGGGAGRRDAADGDEACNATPEKGATVLADDAATHLLWPPTQPAEPEPEPEPTPLPAPPSKKPTATIVVENKQVVLANGKGGPAMAPPPYVHHFDSYSLVKQLHGGGYSEAQATTAMKGIRALLAQNLDVAQQSLVSKSDVENETYLFSAACSELSAEIKNNRRLRDEQMRQQRTHLQHEVDILTQSLNQELLTLNDNVRGMFNDRKMAVREEQKAVDGAIQKIMYKMSILLSSDSRSEIEGVRWVLIRRSVLGIIFMAILTLGTLRYTSYVSQQHKEEAERLRRLEEQGRKEGAKRDHGSAADAAAILAAN